MIGDGSGVDEKESDPLRQAYDRAVESGEIDDEAMEWYRAGAAAAGVAARWAAADSPQVGEIR